MGLQFGYACDSANPTHRNVGKRGQHLLRRFGRELDGEVQPEQYCLRLRRNGQTYIGNQPGAGFFYGASGHDPANGTAGYPGVFNQAVSTAVQRDPIPSLL